MNDMIKSIFEGFAVAGTEIPVAFLTYQGHKKEYVVWQQENADDSFSGDDELLGYVEYLDFDVYAKGNYLEIVEGVKRVLKENGFVWQPSKSSADMYETDTGYYHKTLNFAYMREV